MKYLLQARDIFARWQISQTREPGPSGALDLFCDEAFFAGAMAYWEALLSFVFDQPLDALDYLDQPAMRAAEAQKAHPWTGNGTQMFLNLAKVGIMARQRRVISRLDHLNLNPAIQKSIVDSLLGRAVTLETALLQNIASDGVTDKTTLDSDLGRFTTSYKLAGLLELYRHFPELLDEQGGLDTARRTVSRTGPFTTGDDQANAHNLANKTCADIAMTILSLLEEVKTTGAISIAQTLALLIAGSSLRKPESALPKIPRRTLMEELEAVQGRHSVIERWRTFVRQRVSSNTHQSGLISISMVEPLLEEVWRREDARQQGDSTQTLSTPPTHWLTVMAEMKLETLYG